jgi:hypothetical protein
VWGVFEGNGDDRAIGGNGTDTLDIQAPEGTYFIHFTSGGFEPNEGGKLLPGSAGIVTFAAGGSVQFSEFERIARQ